MSYYLELRMKKFFIGLIVGAVIAFPLGINFGKDAPLLSNLRAIEHNWFA